MLPFHGRKHLETGFFLVQGPLGTFQPAVLFPVTLDAFFQFLIQLPGLCLQLLFPAFQAFQPGFLFLELFRHGLEAFFSFPDFFLQLFLLPMEPFLFLPHPGQLIPGHHQGPHAVKSLRLISL